MSLNQNQENYYANLALTPLPQPHLTGLKLQEDISLDEFVFNRIDEFGVVWVITNIEGWWTLPSPEMPDLKRGWGDGSYDVTGRFNARDLTLEGSFLCPNPNLVAAARNRLVQAVNLVYSGGWLKTSENPTKASFVRLSGDVNIETVNARGRTDFSIGLRAADPLKYEWYEIDEEGYRTTEILSKSISPARTGTAIISNTGNFATNPYLEVQGPIVGPAYIDNLTNNQTITISGTLRPFSTRSISQRALSDGLATLTTTAAHGLSDADLVTITGLGAPFDGVDKLVLTTPTSTTFTIEASGSNTAATPSSGTLTYGPDLLEIDTYNRQVYLNGEYSNARFKLDVYNEWIQLSSGNNTISFRDVGAPSASASKLTVKYRPAWLA